MFSPLSVMGVDELKQPTYFCSVMPAATGNSVENANEATMAARSAVDGIVDVGVLRGRDEARERCWSC